MTRQFELPDGRNIDYTISGAEDGIPLLWNHGTPGAVTPLSYLAAVCEKKGVKLITFSRPGYGGSTRNKGRRVIDSVADTEKLLSHLGISRCFVGGWSGGGPHSLACAARLTGCIAALCVAGVGPYDAEDLDFLAGQGEDNVQELNAALWGEEELRVYCDTQRSEMLQADAAGIVDAMSTLLPDIDKKALLDTKYGVGQSIADSFQEGLKSDSDGWVDDDLEFIEPWGFDLCEIEVPVIVYQGSEDKMVPFAHGEWLAKHLPQEKLEKHLIQGEGHISVFFGRAETMIDSLLACRGLES